MNGYQCYLKRMTSVIEQEVACANKLGYNLGIKLIRGAYMNEERTLAQANGMESPIWNTVEDTHACYNKSMEHIIEGLPDEDSQLFVASHNQDTIDLAKNLLDQTNLKDTECVRFGQLQGFSDQITSTLAAEGYYVYKYLPFGPTDQVMPYLVRRGQESKQVLREQKF